MTLGDYHTFGTLITLIIFLIGAAIYWDYLRGKDD